MNKSSTALALLIATSICSSSFATATTNDYSLSRVEERPIPKSVLFNLWQDVALKQCTKAQENHSISPEQCREKVMQRHPNCERASAAKAPDTVSSKSLAKELGREYLRCVTPYTFCNGVEVRTEQEAREHCR